MAPSGIQSVYTRAYTTIFAPEIPLKTQTSQGLYSLHPESPQRLHIFLRAIHPSEVVIMLFLDSISRDPTYSSNALVHKVRSDCRVACTAAETIWPRISEIRPLLILLG